MHRLTGPDALMLNMEGPTTPMATLKVAVLDTSRRGESVTLADIERHAPAYLGLVPRSVQRVSALPGYGARPFWIPAIDFCLADHLHETTLPGRGTRRQFDALLSELSVAHLDRSRPLWDLTLVHGLDDGRHQAVVVRIHHAVADGLASLNCFRALTTDTPGGVPDPAPSEAAVEADRSHMRRSARRDTARLVAHLPYLLRELAHTAWVGRRFPERHLVPHGLDAHRTSFSTPSRGERVCASASIPLDHLRFIARATGSTLNGVVHGIVAAAVADEMASRGESRVRPAIAMFGVCRDLSSTRTHGNDVATAAAYLHSDIDDPVERVLATARSCAAAVRLRRALGFDLTDKIATYTGRLGPMFRSIAAPWVPRVTNNITTANMPGPRETRWVGDIEITEWISFALAIAPADVNLTMYSYAGRFSLGLITTPESMPDPAGFLARFVRATDEVLAALDTSNDRGMVG